MLKTEDGQFKIEVRRRGGTYFMFSLNSSKFPYSNLRSDLFFISIYNNLDILIKELQLTESDLYILIDNINSLNENYINETYVYLNSTNTDMINNIIYIEKEYILSKDRYNEKINFIIYDYINESMNKLFTINMNNLLDKFIDEIYSCINLSKN